MKSAGSNEIHHCPVCSGFLPSKIMNPHDGVGGRTRLAEEGERALGDDQDGEAGEREREHRRDHVREDLPADDAAVLRSEARDAITNSRFDNESVLARTIRVSGGIDRMPSTNTTRANRLSVKWIGPHDDVAIAAVGRLTERHEHQREDERREREQDVHDRRR